MADRVPSDGFVVLDRNLTIRAASAAYEHATLRGKGELIGQFLFDAFPEDPDDPQANGVARLAASLETAMRREEIDNLWIQRYDIPDPDAPGQFVPRVWSPVNTPLVDHGELVGVVHRYGAEISDIGMALAVIARAIDATGSLPPTEILHTLAAVDAVNSARHLAEVEHLRHAIESRDIIGQAKGMLMERFDVDAAAAFDLLVKLSQDSNTRLEKIARTLVNIDHPPNAADGRRAASYTERPR
ncbi:ANTAR domain-containing protein [Mycobacterium camsae]|uniref:ANTAR domain-containing protein n=1 Tax=Mycobacterium gordonae TaxID=1778 RepID=UPI0019813086|nr:ANTAR domain-containing protein [Mycobacterium gordonae]